MKNRVPNLPPKLRAVLVTLAKGRALSITQAVKLPYLVDVVAEHALGRRITDGTHQTWQYGVVTREAWQFLDRCDTNDPDLRVEPIYCSEEKRIRVIGAPAHGTLTAEEVELIEEVAREFGGVSARELGLMTKLMNPEIKNWGKNQVASTSAQAYDRLRPEYQAMAKRAAAVTLADLRERSFPLDSAEAAIA
jgi:uncharacterized phage-associated protein